MARGRRGQGKALGWSQYQVSMKPSGARPSFSCLPRRGKQGPGEHFTQDRRLLSQPRMSIRSNEAALLSAKSSGSYSGKKKKKNKRAKARGTLPRDSNTNSNYRNIIKTLHFLMKRLRSSQTHLARGKSELEEVYLEH